MTNPTTHPGHGDPATHPLDLDVLQRCLSVGPAENEREDYLARAAGDLVAEVRRLREREAALIRSKDADLDLVRDALEAERVEVARLRSALVAIRAEIAGTNVAGQFSGSHWLVHFDSQRATS